MPQMSDTSAAPVEAAGIRNAMTDTRCTATARFTPAPDSEFDLDVTFVEVADPGHLINMTDDGCGTTCEKSTCISAA